MATSEIRRITEILWEQMKINDESDKKAASSSKNKTSLAKEFSNLHIAAASKSKKPSRSNRDSLAFRESPGKPGTKRFNRYLNTQFLKTAGSLGVAGSSDKKVEMDYSFYEQRSTLFYQDQQNSDFYLDNCVNISCDQEQEILDSITNTNGASNNNSNGRSHENESFSMIKKNLRPFFKKPFLLDNQFIQTTELEVLSFIESSNLNTIEFKQDNPSKRLIIHGVASYYSLLSKSHTTKSGKRILVLRKHRAMPALLPEIPIIQYLTLESKKLHVPQFHQAQRKKVIKKSQHIYTKKVPSIITSTTVTTTTTSLI